VEIKHLQQEILQLYSLPPQQAQRLLESLKEALNG
jgi:hypothetical protein